MRDTKRMCKLCKDTGLIPLKRKDGSVVPQTWLYCDCWEPPRAVEGAVTAQDFDFACSDTFRGYYHQEFDGRDPAYYPPRPDIAALDDRINDLEAETARPGSIPRRYTEELQQVKGQVLYLQGKLNEHTKPRKAKPKLGYKGIK